MKRLGREIALLTLPVLIFCGMALWKTRGGSMAQIQGAPSDIYSGKPRLEIGEIKPLEMTPWDVAQGFVWGIDAKVWQGGQSPVAPGVVGTGGSSWGETNVFYKRGARWIEAKSSDDLSLTRQINGQTKFFGDFVSRLDKEIKVRLNGVPHNAEEVRLRGYFNQTNEYPSAGCSGVSNGPNWKIYLPRGCGFTMHSQPFDIPIVSKKEAWPKPNVSQETPLEFVDAKWIIDSNIEDFVLQIRHKDGSAWNIKSVVGQNIQIFDGDKKPIELIDSRNGTKTRIYNFGSYAQDHFSPQRAPSDLFIPVVWVEDIAPKVGWSNVKFPLTLRAEISDGTCWPLKIDTKVERVQMQTKDFGAAK